jgi:hypothetical protein
MNRSKSAVALAALAASTLVASHAFATFSYSPIALTDVSNGYGPGQGAGIVFPAGANPDTITSAVINNAGQVAFRAVYGTAGFTGDGAANGVFRYDPATGVSLSMKVGDAIAGSAAVSSGNTALTVGGDLNWGPAFMDGNGNIVMRVNGTNASTGSSGWTSVVTTTPAGGTSLIAVNGGLSPVSGLSFGTTSSGVQTSGPYVSSGGTVMFESSFATIAGTGSTVTTSGATANNTAMFLSTGGAPVVGVRRNDVFNAAVPETRSASAPGDLSSSSINSNGVWAFKSSTGTFGLQGSNIVSGTTSNPHLVSNYNDSAIESNVSGTPQVAVERGAAVPGTASTFIDAFNTVPSINNNGVIAFEANLRGNDINGTTTSSATNNVGLFTVTPASVTQMILQKGAAAPGIPGSRITSFGSTIVNVDAGVVFSVNATNTAGSSTVLCRYNYADGSITPIATAGTAATGEVMPGTGGGVLASIGNVTVNDAGNLAFTGQLNLDTGHNQLNYTVLMATDAAGALEKVVESLDAFTVAAGDVRTVSTGAALGSGNNASSINIAGSSAGSSTSDGLQNGLNDNNELVFSLEFDNQVIPGVNSYSNGVFTTYIPEPGTLAPALLSLGLLARRRR